MDWDAATPYEGQRLQTGGLEREEALRDDGEGKNTQPAQDDSAGAQRAGVCGEEEETIAAERFRMFLSDEKDVLDVTGNQLKSLAGIELPPTLTEIDLTTNRMARIDPRIGQSLPSLQKLCLRQNLLTDDAAAELANFSSLSSLRELVLRDNLLKKVPPLSSLCSLTLLDLSYNEIHSMEGIREAPESLRELYLAANKVSHVQELQRLSNLTLLELGFNKIRAMEGLETLTGLRELWLGRNKIREVYLCGLSTSLRRISVQSNRLTHMRGFEACVNLEELYLSHNGITTMEGLGPLTALRVLDLAGNRLTKVEDLHSLTRLEDLWLNDNDIQSLDEFVEAVKVGPAKSLLTLYLERNPCAKQPDYMKRLKDALPAVEQIDSASVYR